jgi:endoglucanase
VAVKKNLFFIFVVYALLLIACRSPSVASDSAFNYNFVPSQPDRVREYPLEPVSGKTAFNYFKDEKIFSGWNLGNTLDSYSGGAGSETIWGNPAINQEIMNGVKAAGFDIIRIPVTWIGHFGMPPDYRIISARLLRVAEVVEMAHNAGLKVIINIHHDGSTPQEGKENGWLSIAKASKDSGEYASITHQFARVWDQIAAYFKNYGDWLMFESMNEIHDGGWGWGYNFRIFPMFQTDIINKWNQIFTDRVRAAGGNNIDRYLVIPAYCTIPAQTLADTFILPNDITPNKQIVTFHYYDPHEFSINGRRSAWGSAADKQKIDDDFAPFQKRFIENNIPVIIGETGAVLQLNPNDRTVEAQARQSRSDYISHVFVTAKKYGLVPIYWDNGATSGNGEKFGLFDRRTGRPNSADSTALINNMINSVK